MRKAAKIITWILIEINVYSEINQYCTSIIYIIITNDVGICIKDYFLCICKVSISFFGL